MIFLEITARIRKKKVKRKKAKPNYPNEKWLTEVIELSITEDLRKLLLSSIMDLYDNRIIEYALSIKDSNHLKF